MKTKDQARKRMMFIQKEDYNYLCYNLILILDTLKCTDEQKKFSDFRKMAYLIDFIGTTKTFDEYNYSELQNIYSKSQFKKKLLSHVLIILKNKQYIDLSINKRHNTFDLWLNPKEIPHDFIDKDFFKDEISQIIYLSKEIGKIKTKTLKKLAEEVFTSRGILTWEI